MAIIYTLVICHTCQKKINDTEAFTLWEDSIYCEECFDQYLELLAPYEWFKKNE